MCIRDRVSGLIFDPIKDEMFFAEKNKGSYLNNQRLRVSKKNVIDDCLFSSNRDGVRFSNFNMISISSNLNIMIKAVEKASKLVIRDFGEVEKLQISKKGPRDFVTKTDKRVENIIIEELSKTKKNYSCLLYTSPSPRDGLLSRMPSSA